MRQSMPDRPDRRSCSRIILTGFRATGKSHTGRLLAERIGYRFIDTDERLASGIEGGISALVSREGWAAFREKERLLLAALADEEQAVIATGGGAILHQDEWRLLRADSLVVWLRADAETIRKRLQQDRATDTLRPTLTGAGALEEVDRVLAEREPLYREGSDLALDTMSFTPERIAAEIAAHLAAKEQG